MASDWTWWLRVVKSIIILSLDHTTWWIEQINSAVKDLQLDIKKWIPPQLCLSKWIPKSRGLTAIEIIPSLIFYDPSQRCLIGGIRLFEGHIHWIYWIWLIHLDKVITEMADAVSFQPREFPVGSQDSTAPFKRSNHPHLHDFNILVRSLTARHRSQFHLTSDHW